MSKLLELSNPVFSSYVLWSSVLVLKMLAMSLLTAVHRFKNQVSSNLFLHNKNQWVNFIETNGSGGAIFNDAMSSPLIVMFTVHVCCSFISADLPNAQYSMVVTCHICVERHFICSAVFVEIEILLMFFCVTKHDAAVLICASSAN